jgi:hypothetical protein
VPVHCQLTPSAAEAYFLKAAVAVLGISEKAELWNVYSKVSTSRWARHTSIAPVFHYQDLFWILEGFSGCV